MLNCNEVLAVLQDHLDGDLGGSVRAEMEAHLAHCKTCQVIYDSTRKTLKIVTESRSFELPEEVSDEIQRRVMKRIRSGQGESSSEP